MDMQFSQIKEGLKDVSFDALRTDCDNYFEAVILKEELTKLTERLANLFGSPAWPSKNRLSFRIQEAIKGFGGIMPGQTLYSLEQGSDAVFAMLWPWQDGKHTTIKIIKK
jgi:hypothetical protein